LPGGQKYELSMSLGENTPVFKPWVRGKNMILKTNIHPCLRVESRLFSKYIPVIHCAVYYII